MTERKSLLSNIFFSALSWMSSFVFLALLILAARFLGDEVYGQFAFAYSLVALFEVATDLGMRDYLVREVSRAKEKTSEYLGMALIQKTILSMIAVTILFLTASLLDLRYEVRIAVRVLTLAMVCKSYKLLFRAILIAHERFSREAFIVYVERAVLLLACTAALVVGEGLLPFVVVFLVAGVVGLVLTYLGTGKSLRTVSRPTGRIEWREMWRKALPFGLTAAAMMIYFRLDSVMLSLMRNDAEVGWYNAAYRLTEGLIVIPSVLYYVLFPRLSVLHQEAHADVQDLARKACKYMIAMALAIAAVGIVESDRLVRGGIRPCRGRTRNPACGNRLHVSVEHVHHSAQRHQPAPGPVRRGWARVDTERGPQFLPDPALRFSRGESFNCDRRGLCLLLPVPRPSPKRL